MADSDWSVSYRVLRLIAQSVRHPTEDTVVEPRPPLGGGNGGPQLRKPPRHRIVVSSHFKLIFLTITGLTVLSMIGSVVISWAWDHPTANQQSVFEGFGWVWKVGFGAIVGLLGGKAV